MGEYLFLSEYCGLNRTAHVFLDRESKEFVVKCFQRADIVDTQYFKSEWDADIFAEDWVLGQ